LPFTLLLCSTAQAAKEPRQLAGQQQNGPLGGTAHHLTGCLHCTELSSMKRTRFSITSRSMSTTDSTSPQNLAPSRFCSTIGVMGSPANESNGCALLSAGTTNQMFACMCVPSLAITAHQVTTTHPAKNGSIELCYKLLHAFK